MVAFNFRFPYYTCVLPRQIECPIVGTEADKKTKCADCVLWETRFVDQRVAPTLDMRRYTYRPNRRLTASYLISDLTKEIAALKDPEDGAVPRLEANSFDSIRKNPEYHDLLQVEFGPRTDAILISPSMGGAALWKSESSTQTLGSSIDNYALWYVSDAEKGKLTFSGNATDVFRSADIRAFAPLSLVRAAESSAKPSVFWNVRATKPAPQGGGTATTLDIGFEYQVVFTLEHLLRQKELGGTLGSKQGLLKWIEDNFLNEVPGDPVFVNIILLTDDHVEVLGSRVAHVELEVDEIRRWLSEKVAPDEVKPFLRATFKVRALRSGTVPMTVAMWDDYGRPIDDFRTAAICVHACSATTPLQPASLGIDSARAAAAGATPPDLSIQLLQVGDDVFGMLHRRDTAACPEDYCIWRVASSLRTYLADLKSATDGFAAAMTGNDRLIAGKKASSLSQVGLIELKASREEVGHSDEVSG